MSNSNIPELTKFQYEMMERAANLNGVLVARDPYEGQTEEKKAEFAGHIRAFEALTGTGLLSNASHEPDYADGIAKCREAEGYGYTVYRLTDHAVKLFRTGMHRGVN